MTVTLNYKRGDTLNLLVTVYTSGPVVQDLTGMTATAQIRSGSSYVQSLVATIGADPTTGQVVVGIAAEDMVAWPLTNRAVQTFGDVQFAIGGEVYSTETFELNVLDHYTRGGETSGTTDPTTGVRSVPVNLMLAGASGVPENLAASVYAQQALNAATQTAADRVQTGLDVDAAEAARDDAQAVAGIKEFRDRATLLANSTLTYTAGQAATVAAGDIIRTRDDGTAYEVAASGATNNSDATAGGIKMYRLYPEQIRFRSVSVPGGPVLATAGAGPLTGLYYYRITYLTAEGETAPGALTSISTSSNQVQVTLPVSTDHRVTGRRIYRSAANPGSSVWLLYHVADVSDNTTTTYVDAIADGSLGNAIGWEDLTATAWRNTNPVQGDQIVAALGEQMVRMGINTRGGYASTVVGTNAMGANVTGARNTAFGHDALKSNTTGFNMTALGVHAFNDNVSGNGGVAVGYSAGFKNTTGISNVFVGQSAGSENTTGSQNVFLGSGAGFLRVSGDDNIAIGFQAGRSSSGTGAGNIAIGRNTMLPQTTGNFNTVIGHLAGQSVTSPTFNTFIGAYAGQRVTTGGSNVFLGGSAGSWFTTEGNRLMIDNQARTNLADAEAKALITGTFATDRNNQIVTLNARAVLNGGVILPSVAVTANYTVLNSDYGINVTGSGTVTLTLPSPNSFAGKVLHVRTKAAHAVVSASSNVVPLAGGAAGTAILPATAGSWATLQAVGGFWEIIAAG